MAAVSDESEAIAELLIVRLHVHLQTLVVAFYEIQVQMLTNIF